MSVSRLIFELWIAIQNSTPPLDVFQIEDTSRLQSMPEYTRVASALECQTDNYHLAIMLSLRSLAIQQHDLADKLSFTELVLTLPVIASTNARPTLYVIREMIESAQVEIILAGYRVTSSEILELLHEAARRHVRIMILCGRSDGDAENIRATWPREVRAPELFQDVERGTDLVSLMHIKALLVDSSHLLVSSANFTHGGMLRNIEFGLRTSGQAAIEAKTVLSQLMKSPLCERIVER